MILNHDGPPRPTELAHLLIRHAVQTGDFAIDATCGKGFDTLFLAHAIGKSGSVLALDIQPQAIAQTQDRLAQENLSSRVQLVQACHSQLLSYTAPNQAAVIVFNLGYLPGGDHSLVTKVPTTLAALDAAHKALRPAGLLLVTAYPGHADGHLEANAVHDWFQKIAHQGMRVSRYEHPFTLKPAPILWLAHKSQAQS